MIGFVTLGFVVAGLGADGASVRLNLRRQDRMGPTLAYSARLSGSSSRHLFSTLVSLLCRDIR